MVDLENNNLNISLLAEENISSSLINENLQVIFDTSTNISVKPALSYIKSGQKEINDYVSNVAEPRLSEYVQTAENQMQNCVNAVQKFADDIVDKGFVKTVDLQNALEGKQDVISDLPAIRNGATLGATAVQPADLASVATSGSYNDLSNKPDLNGKANIDLSNITSEGKNIANWSTNVTNCITEIPQDIKLEFTGSNMILKAGSKVTFGDGTFITINVDKNIPFNITSADKYVVCYTKYSNSLIYNRLGSQTASGTTTPTSGYWTYYNTTDKKVYDINNGVNAGELSLPLCIFSSDTSSITSIDQVFNGFGYIGSTVYALPGVKGLIPNGRNEDGSLKNIEFTVDSVKTVTRTWVDNNNQVWGYIKNPPAGAAETWYWNGYIESDEEPSYNEYVMWYKPSENITYMNNGAQSSTPNWEKVNYINFGKASGINSQEIKIFTPKTTFHAVDSNDSSWLSGLGMPSNKYIDLTLGASGTVYVAPANGYFLLYLKTTTSGGFCWAQLVNWSKNDFVNRISTDIYGDFSICLPVNKGDNVALDYENIALVDSWNKFRFYYAEGENV